MMDHKENIIAMEGSVQEAFVWAETVDICMPGGSYTALETLFLCIPQCVRPLKEGDEQ